MHAFTFYRIFINHKPEGPKIAIVSMKLKIWESICYITHFFFLLNIYEMINEQKNMWEFNKYFSCLFMREREREREREILKRN